MKYECSRPYGESVARYSCAFSKAEPYNGSKRDVIVNKNEMMDLLKELNGCMYDMMDEHELSQTKRTKRTVKCKNRGTILFCGFP